MQDIEPFACNPGESAMQVDQFPALPLNKLNNERIENV
jgi:hypothetical protein